MEITGFHLKVLWYDKNKGDTVQTDLFCLLRNRAIIAILDGDTTFGNYTFKDGSIIKISMPYVTGSDLCSMLVCQQHIHGVVER